MTEVQAFLQDSLSSDPDARRYFNSLLSKSLTKLERERSILSSEEQEAEKKLDTQAIEQSKVCFQASLALREVKGKCREVGEMLKTAVELGTNAKKEADDGKGQQVLTRLHHLKAIKSQQAALSELLEIPAVLHTLHSAGMYEEMLRLLRYTKELTGASKAPLLEKLGRDAMEYQNLLEGSIQAELATTLDETRTKKALKLIEELLGLSSAQLLSLYLRFRLRYFTNRTDSKQSPASHLLTSTSTLQVLLQALSRDQSLFPASQASIQLFLFDRTMHLLEEYREKLPAIEKISDLKAIWTAAETLDTAVLRPIGFSIYTETRSMLISAYSVLISSLVRRTQQNFESMLRLYQWDNTSQKDPLLKFGGVSVLYNNCIYVVNEVRGFRLEEVGEALMRGMAELMVNVAQFVVVRGQHLRGSGPRTPQQNVYRTLFFDFLESLRKSAFPAVIAALSDTFPDLAPSPLFVLPIQTTALDVLNEVETSGA